MKYSVNLRMKNPGPAKYLIESCEVDNITNAFYAATNMITANEGDHFVEIIDNNTNEKVAGINEGESNV